MADSFFVFLSAVFSTSSVAVSSAAGAFASTVLDVTAFQMYIPTIRIIVTINIPRSPTPMIGRESKNAFVSIFIIRPPI